MNYGHEMFKNPCQKFQELLIPISIVGNEFFFSLIGNANMEPYAFSTKNINYENHLFRTSWPQKIREITIFWKINICLI